MKVTTTLISIVGLFSTVFATAIPASEASLIINEMPSVSNGTILEPRKKYKPRCLEKGQWPQYRHCASDTIRHYIFMSNANPPPLFHDRELKACEVLLKKVLKIKKPRRCITKNDDNNQEAHFLMKEIWDETKASMEAEGRPVNLMPCAVWPKFPGCGQA